MKVYFSGIGGVGLGPLAQICLDCGWEVVGSDINSSLITEELAKRGVNVSFDQTGIFLEQETKKGKVDVYVYSSAVKEDNLELQKAKELGIHTTKRSGIINTILKEKKLKLLAIAGTHGKTTTTAMCVWLFKQLGLPVSYSIGTTLSWAHSAAYQLNSEWFVYECDEFDRNFLDFQPDISLITTMDYDHPDTYATRREYLDAFQLFARQSKTVYTWEDIARSLHSDNSHVFVSTIKGLELAGEHNRRNMTLALHVCSAILNQQLDSLLPYAQTFPGTQRRFERIGYNLYSDYAHHPVEIAATIQLAKEICSRVVVVYQPHQNLRQYEVKEQYTDCFSQTEKVYWLPTYLSREPKELPVLTPQQLTQNIHSADIIFSELDTTLKNNIQKDIEEGCLVVAMGAGSIDNWVRSISILKA